ncbi:MAG: sigma-54 dependent transcriptional regulator [Anaerovorax sp.]
MGEKVTMNQLVDSFCLTTKNPLFQKTLDFCTKVASSNANVLLSGESGSGKEILAKYIHANSLRSNHGFVAVNCTSYSDTLLESELFGHEQGAFTGASYAKAGKFELAHNGTLFLDEIGDMQFNTQVKLLRTIETKCTERIGSNISNKIDFRLISATHQDLKAAVFNETFREDFFYRISTVVINVPPLRERHEDLDYFIDFFLRASSKENNKEIRHIQPEVFKFLHEYNYPGNIRELKNIIERMVILSENGSITVDGLPIMFAFRNSKKQVDPLPGSKFDKIIPFQEFKRQAEKEYLEWVFTQVGGNVAEAARQLKISNRQLFNKINELEIQK